MSSHPSRILSLTLGLIALLPVTLRAADPGAQPSPVKASGAKASSSLDGKCTPEKATDGTISDSSRWVSGKEDANPWIEISLPSVQKLGGIHLYSGFKEKDAVEDFSVQFWKDGKWQEIPSAVVSGNKATAVSVPFDQTVDVVTDKIRILVTKSPKGPARIKEVVIWPFSSSMPSISGSASGGGTSPSSPSSPADASIPEIYLNQSGFNLGEPKRFTAPTLSDGTKFIVRPAKGGAELYSGVITGNKGDFSAFNPDDTQEFVVEAGGITSEPFRIGHWWLERVTYQNMVNFMIDSRHRVGNEWVKCTGSFGWRDDHHFGWELTTLVPQYISNPSAYERMPHQVKYRASSDPKLWGTLEPPSENAPDIVKLIQWGADVIVSQKLTHEMMKSQLAYFLYAWPVLKQYLPEQNYRAVRDFAFGTWSQSTIDIKYPYDESTDHNLLAVKTKIGTTKGSFPPGFSVEPNVLMYEVAKREKMPDAEKFINAAKAQAEWMIKNLDWSDPRVTKGQRMSEFLTITGLATFQRLYPDKAPAGLLAKINDWANVMIRRSNNMWDFRKLDDGEKWTPMEAHPQKWNEAGNVVGLPAALLAAKQVVTDPAMKKRLDEIAWAHFDDMMGRNPLGRCFSYRSPNEIEGVKHGWVTFCAGGIGRLSKVRFVIDGSPKDFHYPYHPELWEKGYTEGWIQFNTPFNESMAYLAYDRTKLTLSKEGEDLVIRLEAPINFDYSKVETATVTVTSSNGQSREVTVTEESPNSRFFTGRIKLSQGSSSGGAAITVPAGGSVEVSYGFGFLGHKATLKP